MARIVYLSWPAEEITGGIKMIFRHVEALSQAGFSAVVATRDGKAPNWFQTSAEVISIPNLQGDDVLVFPENNVEFLRDLAPSPNRKVVFCQNQFMVYRGLGAERCYSEFGVSEILCPSYPVLHYCRRRFPGMKLGHVPYFVDLNLFACPPEKRVQIAFAPRKRPLEAAFIQDLFLAEYPDLRGTPWVELAGASESQMAQAMAQSAVFLSLSRYEAFGLTTLESLACGCLAVGFTGIGGSEYATAKNGFWVPENDCYACCDQLARAVRLAAEGGAIYQSMVAEATATAACYGPDQFRAKLAAYWRSKLD